MSFKRLSVKQSPHEQKKNKEMDCEKVGHCSFAYWLAVAAVGATSRQWLDLVLLSL